MQRGSLVVFEGLDDVGKTSLSKLLTKELQKENIPAEWHAFPGSEKANLGRFVDQLHHSPSNLGVSMPNPISLQLLHVAAHIENIRERILPALDQGRPVILDRYWWSTFAYGRGSGIDHSTLRKMIALEIDQWHGVVPAVVCLVRRNNEECGESSRSQVLAAYEELISIEHENYPVKQIQNDSSLNDALVSIMKLKPIQNLLIHY